MLERLCGGILKAYGEFPLLLREHHGIEQVVLAGGYGYRQILELVQNGADAALEGTEQGCSPPEGHRMRVLIRSGQLYAANTGAPLSEEGLGVLLSSHYSTKKGNQIGRFGLGFKALLQLNGQIDIFTRASGSVRFDPERCRRELREKFSVQEAPGLRLAWPLAESERASDATLQELAWAETIVRAQINHPGAADQLQQEIAKFPAEFLLFLPISLTLELEDGTGTLRVLKVDSASEEKRLYVGRELSRWRVVSKQIRISDERARADATHIHAREEVPIAWAIPLEGRREEAGRFWAFFPTQTATYLTGILNAPWKLNSDRNAIIGGDWNFSLMEKAAELVVETLPTLASPEDPAKPLDAFPRQPERKDELGAFLAEKVWRALEQRALVPDGNGELRPPQQLWRHPKDSAALARQWHALADRDQNARLVHASCYERQRGARLNTLADRLASSQSELPNLRNLSPQEWFAAVASPSHKKASHVLKLAEAFANDCTRGEWDKIRPSLEIIPTSDGRLVSAEHAVLAPEGTPLPDGLHGVSPQLLADDEARRILVEVMEVGPLDESLWKKILSEQLPWSSHGSEARWLKFWDLLRSAPERVQESFIHERASWIRVCRRDGQWVRPSEALLPGRLVSPEDAFNSSLLVDEATHSNDEKLLKKLKVNDFPEGKREVSISGYNSGLFSEWVDYWRSYYLDNVSSSPRWEYLGPKLFEFPLAFHFLPELRSTANARLTTFFLGLLKRNEFPATVSFGHDTVKHYPQVEVQHPLPWFLMKYGLVAVSNSGVRLAAVVARAQEPAVRRSKTWSEVEPLLELLRGALPAVEVTRDELEGLWLALVSELATPERVAGNSLQDLWHGAAKDGVVPKELPSMKGWVPLSEVYVTGSHDLASYGRAAGLLVVTLDEHTLPLWLEKGAQNLTNVLRPQWEGQASPDVLLVSVFPELAELMKTEIIERALCQPVKGLKILVAGQPQSGYCLMWGSRLLVDLAQLAAIPRVERLKALLQELAPLGWLRCSR
ncbi:MAG: hypothetical protein NZ869_10240, partial [Thermoanaerobaculum sp.]|nr:hypothetical protein [Thermoanaerobaculum sp.]